MKTFNKQITITDGKTTPSDDRYCIVMMYDGDIQKAFYRDGDWIFSDGFYLQRPCIKAWFYVEDVFDMHEQPDIRMYVDAQEGQI